MISQVNATTISINCENIDRILNLRKNDEDGGFQCIKNVVVFDNNGFKVSD